MKECHLIPKEENTDQTDAAGDGDIELGNINNIDNNHNTISDSDLTIQQTHLEMEPDCTTNGDEKTVLASPSSADIGNADATIDHDTLRGYNKDKTMSTTESFQHKSGSSPLEIPTPQTTNSTYGPASENLSNEREAADTSLSSSNNAAHPVPIPTVESAAMAETNVPHSNIPDSTALHTNNNLPQDRPHNAPTYSSLYEVTSPFDYDDEDEDNKYSALSIPYAKLINSLKSTNSTNHGSTCDSTAPPSPLPLNDGEPRIVSASCAICLLSYTPGCYITWASNDECLHVFHRDCILMWLLKKEEPVCPCCRRDFVPNSVLNRDENYTSDGGGGGGGINRTG